MSQLKHENILLVENISKEYETSSHQKLHALRDINLTVKKGQTLGIVGESGCGKSTLAKIVLQLTPPTKGKIYYKDTDLLALKGESLRLMRKNIQAVFQDTVGSFNPRMKVAEIICAPLLNYGLISKRQVDSQAKELLKKVQLPEAYANQYPFSLSGGERQRVGIARAIALEPEMIVCDEATSALDVTTQSKIIQMLIDLQKQMNLTLLFISHDLVLVHRIAHQTIVMYAGSIVEVIEGKSLRERGQHPYTKTLIESSFSMNMDFNKSLKKIDGQPANHIGESEGCSFYSRCSSRMNICKKIRPQLRKLEENHHYVCHL